MVNNCVKRMTPRFRIKKNIASVLDDYNFQSTKTLKDFNQIVISQNDKSHYDKMMYNIPIKNIRMFYCDYEHLTETFFDSETIDVDHADFCQSWDSMKEGIFNRLENNVYSNRALLRLTDDVTIRYTWNGDVRMIELVVNKMIMYVVDYHLGTPLEMWSILYSVTMVDYMLVVKM
eukprot:gene10708-12666_t